MSDSDSREILTTRLNKYIANLRHIRNSPSEIFSEERDRRLGSLKEALAIVSRETWARLQHTKQPVTLETIADIKADIESRIQTLSSRSKPVYRELRDTLVNTFEAYIQEHTDYSSLELDILHLNTLVS